MDTTAHSTCPACGTPFEPAWTHCAACGESIGPEVRSDDVLERLAQIERRLSKIEQNFQLPQIVTAKTGPLVFPPQPGSSVKSAPAAPQRPPTPMTLPVPSEYVREAPQQAADETQGRADHQVTRPTWTSLLGQRLASHWLSVIGGLAILIGAVFFLSLAFSRGWIGPELRVVIGAAVGLSMMTGGFRFFTKSDRMTGHVLVAVGSGISTLSTFAAHRLYDLIPLNTSLFAAGVVGLLTTAIAVRFRLHVVAVYGVSAVQLAPPILGATADEVVFAFLLLSLVSATLIAIRTGWMWLPVTSFLILTPQLVNWAIGEPSSLPLIVVVYSCWLLFATGAANRLLIDGGAPMARTSVSLLVGSGPLALLTMAIGLAGRDVLSTGLLPLGFAVGYLVLGTVVRRLEGNARTFGEVTLATGVGFLALAPALQFGANGLALSWALQMLVLGYAWLRTRIHSFAIWSFLFGLGAIAVTTGLVLPLSDLEQGTGFSLHRSGLLTLAGLIAANGIICLLWPFVWPRRYSLVVIALAVAYGSAFLIADYWLIGTWTATVTTLLLAERGKHFAGQDVHEVESGFSHPLFNKVATVVRRSSQWLPETTGILLLGYTVLRWIGELVESGHSPDSAFDVPYLHGGAIAGMGLIAACLVLRRAQSGNISRALWTVAAIGITAVALVPDLQPAGITIGFALLAMVPIMLSRREQPVRLPYLGAAAVLGTLASAFAFGSVSMPDRLAVHSVIEHPPIPFLNWGVVGLIAIAALGQLCVSLWGSERWARIVLVMVAGVALYAICISIVDAFQHRVATEADIDSVSKQAQVTMSIVLAAIGFSALIIGGARRNRTWQIAGLAVLVTATIKVFVVDLATLSTSYRVLSFVGLGVLLLVAGYLYKAIDQSDGEELGAEV